MAIMLLRLRSALFLVPLCLFAGCGGSGTPTFSVVPTFVAGDYILVISPGMAGATRLIGAITANTGVNSNSVTGVFGYNNAATPTCGGQVLNLTGTLNTNSSILTLTSAVFAGSTATFTVQLPLITNTSGTTVGSGTAVIAGGTCALASTTLQAQLIPSFNGTWTGLLSGAAASFNIVEGAANANGQFALTVQGSMCGLTTQPTLTGTVTGTSLQATGSGITFSATPGANFNTLGVSVTCSGSNPNTYSGTLTN